LVEAGNRFWRELSELCNRYIDAAPAHLRDQYMAYLRDRTSIYGGRRWT
jgi:hypothetical protein